VAIGSGDVNDYLRDITGEDFTAKDFRTWAGTLQAVEALEAVGPAATQREAKAAILQAIDLVAGRLNNTRAVCRKYYVHPAVLETYEAGTLHHALQNGGPPKSAASALSPEEQAVVRLLRHVA
jgi:DNA topoisomerase I